MSSRESNAAQGRGFVVLRSTAAEPSETDGRLDGSFGGHSFEISIFFTFRCPCFFSRGDLARNKKNPNSETDAKQRQQLTAANLWMIIPLATYSYFLVA